MFPPFAIVVILLRLATSSPSSATIDIRLNYQLQGIETCVQPHLQPISPSTCTNIGHQTTSAIAIAIVNCHLDILGRTPLSCRYNTTIRQIKCSHQLRPLSVQLLLRYQLHIFDSCHAHATAFFVQSTHANSLRLVRAIQKTPTNALTVLHDFAHNFSYMKQEAIQLRRTITNDLNQTGELMDFFVDSLSSLHRSLEISVQSLEFIYRDTIETQSAVFESSQPVYNETPSVLGMGYLFVGSLLMLITLHTTPRNISPLQMSLIFNFVCIVQAAFIHKQTMGFIIHYITLFILGHSILLLQDNLVSQPLNLSVTTVASEI